MHETLQRSAPQRYKNLTSGRLLARNTVFNLVGSLLPMVVALICIPPTIRGLGTDRFGILTLAWAVIGYASLFDLGLGRALTKLVAEQLGTDEQDNVCALVWTSLLLMLGLGIAGALLMGLLSPWMAHRALRVPLALQPETLKSFYLLAISVPIVVVSAGLRGLLQALQRFDLINAIGIPSGILTFASPLLVLLFTKNLVSVVAVLVVLDILGFIICVLFCFRAMPDLARHVGWQRSKVSPLFRFGGWMTVSNFVNPLMVTSDRFLIGSLVSIAAVAYYATPYEIVTKLWIIPGALVGVLFPAFTTSFVQNVDRTALLFGRAVKYIFLGLFPVTLIIVAFGGKGLTLWLGADFASRGEHVLQWLAVGVFINSLAHVPFALVQGVGRPDLTAKLHLLELPSYLFALWYLTRRYGVDGAAVAWVLRVSLDALLLFMLSARVLRDVGKTVSRLGASLVAALLVFGLIIIPMAVTARVLVVSGVLFAFATTTWFVIVSRDERAILHWSSEGSNLGK